MSPHERAMRDYLTRIGAGQVRVIPGGKHNLLVFTFRGQERSHIISKSPGDSVYGPKKAVADLKRMLGLRHKGKREGERRRAARRSRRRDVSPCPYLTALPDWRVKLQELAQAMAL